MTGLPAGLRVRPIRLEDAEAITAQLGAYTTALLGFPKNSLEDVENYLRDPAIDLATDGWAVVDGDEIVGSATSMANSSADRINLDVTAIDPAVAAWLLDRTIDRATEQARDGGQHEVTINLAILRDDPLLPALAADRGLSIRTSIQRMQILHNGAVKAPETPAGVVVRRGVFDDATRRTAHEVLTASFAAQPGADPRPYGEWLESRERRSTFDWSQLTMLEIDGRAVAVRECNDNFVSTDGCGYIGRLCVLEEARGRGLAKFLLREAFALDAAAGLRGTMLHVDSSNPTAAVGLYLGVGMRPTVISDIWRRVLTLS